MPYAVLLSAFDPFFPKGWLYYWISLYLDDLGQDVIGSIADYATNRPSPMSLMALWHVGGGAASRVPSGATAFGKRDAPYLLSFDTTWTDPADTEWNIAWTRAAWSDMQRFGSGGLYLNFAGFGEEKEALVRSGYGANYDRLARLKARYDPTNLFHMNQNIAPLRESGSAARMD
jgi:FAD/FMN-containing dehydrogenase